MFKKVLKSLVVLGLPKAGFSNVLKANPYHDERGRFATHDSARFVSVGGVFDKQRAKTKVPLGDGRKGLAKYVDFDAPLRRIDALNERVRETNADRLRYGFTGELTPLRVKPVEGKGFGDLSEEEIRDAFSAENTSIYMAMSRATLLKVIKGDAIKNSLETGTGTFSKIGEERAVKEKEFLGVKADTSDPEGFPKYGFVGVKGAMEDQGIVGFGYGSLYVEFKDEIRERTTATIGDSFNGNSSGRYRIPAPIDAMGGAQFYGDDPTGWDLAKNGMAGFDKSRPNVRDLARTSEYIEAQIYGKLNAGNIASIHVESEKDAKALTAALKKSGLDIQVKHTKTHTTLSRLAEGYLEDWDKVGPQDIAKLGDAYLAVGWRCGVGSNMWAKGWKDTLPSLNLPKLKDLMKKYPKEEDVPVDLRREAMIEYVTEARKGASGTFPKVLHRKASVRDGFTDDVLNKDLLRSYQ